MQDFRKDKMLSEYCVYQIEEREITRQFIIMFKLEIFYRPGILSTIPIACNYRK